MTRSVSSQKGLKPPIKLASYGGVWRYDGRDEEFRAGESWRDAYKSTD